LRPRAGSGVGGIFRSGAFYPNKNPGRLAMIAVCHRRSLVCIAKLLLFALRGALFFFSFALSAGLAFAVELRVLAHMCSSSPFRTGAKA
jgi:hypothetical protein